MAIEPIQDPLTLDDMRAAMVRSATGIVKVENHQGNMGLRAELALLHQINVIIKAKEAK